MTHPTHASPSPLPTGEQMLLHPGGRAVRACTDAEYAALDLGGDRVLNVIAQFRALSWIGSALALWPSPLVDDPRYTSGTQNAQGRDNHFQGIQRLRHSGHVAVSGGDPHFPMSHLFLARVPSRPVTGDWGSNLLPSGLPPEEDAIVARLDLSATLWHPGGMALLGDVLAIPLENSDGGGSRIRFLSLHDPTNPTDLESAIDRPGVKAGAVALTRLPDDRFLVAVWSDSERRAPKKHLDMYVSDGTTLLRASWRMAHCLTMPVKDVAKFQTIAFARDVAADGNDGDLFLLGFENDAKVSPSPDGPHKGILYHVLGPVDDPAAPPTLVEEAVHLFACEDGCSDMDAGVGLYVDGQQRITVYCSHHFVLPAPKRKMLVRFQEFAGAASWSTPSQVGSLEEAWVSLTTGVKQGGLRLMMSRGLLECPNLDGLFMSAGAPVVRVRSLEGALPKGFALVLYPKPKLRGSPSLAIAGTGRAMSIPDLQAHGYAGKARSCSIVARRVAEKLKGVRWV